MSVAFVDTTRTPDLLDALGEVLLQKVESHLRREL